MRATYLLLLALASAVSPLVAGADYPSRNEARSQQVTLEFAGKTRRYVLYLPDTSAHAGPLPLLVALHGGGGHAEFMADDERYGLIGKAERAGFAVVFPNGHSRLPRGRLATWNAGGCCGNARDTGSDDVGFIRAVVADVVRRTPIDRQRISPPACRTAA